MDLVLLNISKTLGLVIVYADKFIGSSPLVIANLEVAIAFMLPLLSLVTIIGGATLL